MHLLLAAGTGLFVAAYVAIFEITPQQFPDDRGVFTAPFQSAALAEAIGHTSIRGDEWLEHPGSVGRPQDCEIRILDEEGNEVADGEVGEIVVDCTDPTLFLGYWRQPDLRAADQVL